MMRPHRDLALAENIGPGLEASGVMEFRTILVALNPAQFFSCRRI